MDPKQLCLLGIIIVLLIVIIFQYPFRSLEYLTNSNSSFENTYPQFNMRNNFDMPNTEMPDIEMSKYETPKPCFNMAPIMNPPLPPNPYELMRKYDYETLENPLVPPLKRDDFNIPVIPIATRGYPTAFKKMGLLVDKTADNSDKYKFLILIGRQKYPSSNWYEYYATENNVNGYVKFDLSNVKRELFTDDVVRINELGKEYVVVLDRNLGYEYVPFLA